MKEQREILFTGGSGLLGREVRQLLPGALFPTHSEFDITNSEQMTSYMEGKRVRLVIHAAAFTSPPRIDENPEKAIDVNIVGTSEVVKLCKRLGMKLIYICTDYMFQRGSGKLSRRGSGVSRQQVRMVEVGRGVCRQAVRLLLDHQNLLW